MNVDLLSSQSAAAVDRRETPEHHNDTESYNDASEDSYCTEGSCESSEDWWEGKLPGRFAQISFQCCSRKSIALFWDCPAQRPRGFSASIHPEG